ncbi:RNA helicase [Blastocladiella emersonii ATCC 22665]|nr:RNA helicase [Blastocladiella emersonii ATCC 22665]
MYRLIRLATPCIAAGARTVSPTAAGAVRPMSAAANMLSERTPLRRSNNNRTGGASIDLHGGNSRKPGSSSRTIDLLAKRPARSQFQLLDPPSSPATDARGAAIVGGTTKFEDLGLDADVTQAMVDSIKASFGADAPSVLRPTEIQALTARELIASTQEGEGEGVRAVLMAAETGSGKTLAYLAPVFHRIRAEEEAYKVDLDAYTRALADAQQVRADTEAANAEEGAEQESLPKLPKKPLPLRRPGYPRAVVLVPSHELLMQVGAVAKAMSHTARARVVAVSTSTSDDHVKRVLADPVDILVTTPGTLRQFLAKDTVRLAEARTVVYDEADFIFDQGFAEEATAVLKQIRAIVATRSDNKMTANFVFVTATLPKSLNAVLESTFAPAQRRTVASSALHRPLTRCTQRFVDVARQFQGNKSAALADVLHRLHAADTGATLVFANTRQGVDAVYSYLAETRGLPNVLRLSKRQTLEERAHTWHAFRTVPGSILVATDVAARGLDTTHVSLVVNYDFPVSALEYLHRIGRTARAGRTGCAVSLVTKRSRDLVLAIQQRLRMRAGMGVLH